MIASDSDRAWRRFGRTDPYFGVCSHPRFRGAASDGAVRDEFFQSGEDYVQRVFTVLREDFSQDFKPQRALDFGCGVGRVLVPLARRVTETAGIDISPDMLSEAQRNCAHAGLSNVTFHLSNDTLAALGARTFDFIHSYIVLQHIPTRRGMKIIGSLVDRLEPGGLGVLHVTYAYSGAPLRRFAYSLCAHFPGAHVLANVQRGRSPFRPLMQMNLYSLNSLFTLLEGRGCHRVGVRFSNHSQYLGALLFFQRSKQRLF